MRLIRSSKALSLDRAPFVPSRGGLPELAVDKKVFKNATWTPCDAVRPPLDTGRLLLVDEDAAASGKLRALSVVWTTLNKMKLPN